MIKKAINTPKCIKLNITILFLLIFICFAHNAGAETRETRRRFSVDSQTICFYCLGVQLPIDQYSTVAVVTPFNFNSASLPGRTLPMPTVHPFFLNFLSVSPA